MSSAPSEGEVEAALRRAWFPVAPSALISSHRTAERWGLVWCCLDEPAVDLPDPEELADLAWSYGQGRPMRVAAGIRNATENFRDVAHFPFVHRRTTGELPHTVEPLDVARDGPSVRLTRPAADGRHHSTIFWIEGVSDDLEGIALEECLDSEARAYEEDNPILDLLEPSEAPLDVSAQVHTPADRYTLEYRRAFMDYVKEAT